MDLTLIEIAHGGPAAARNVAAVRARGAVLVFTGDDCAPCRDWLLRLDQRVRANPDAAVGGAIVHALPEDLYATASHLLIDYLYGYYNADPEHASFFTPNNLAMPRDRFLALGGFDESFSWGTGEDRDLCDRWLRAGERMVYAPEVRVLHRHPSSLGDLWRQHFRYGYGSRSFRARVAVREAAAIRLEPLRFYLRLVAHPMVQPAGNRKLRLSLLLALTQVANAIGFLWPRRPRTPTTTPDAPTVPRP